MQWKNRKFLLHSPSNRTSISHVGISTVCYTILEVSISVGVRQWRWPCNLLQQLCSRRINISPWWVALRLLLSLTLRGTHIRKHFFLLSHQPILTQTLEDRITGHSHAPIHFSFTKIPTSLQLIREQNT